ncbi:apiosidase-like domain-containing protein [Paenibacillus sp. QZ-Y1]|uniref:apiosidase-like domain-containing protein n=1 Tax=Paenibacillus sp. QZ-Y1 TaxID=3414511 RepID=UPI003F78E704
MIKLEIAENKRHFISGGAPFFYLADTVWSAFTNISMEEWNYYLDYRKSQGFNVLQINLLRQWDASGSDLNQEPFARCEDDTYDFYSLNEEYFERAEQMVEIAVNKGFVPALVLLWCNYIPDTWASRIREDKKMPLDAVEPYVRYAADRFSKYYPIYIVSGDTDFPSERANEYYRTALHAVKKYSPECLTTLHIQGRLAEVPAEFINDGDLDFYMYQSGHNSQFQSTAYTLAMDFNSKSVTRPVLNSEPCYEMMGYSRQGYGRFSRADVRKAAWQSLLSGAAAGVTYGAHGIWSWHKKGRRFGVTGEGFDSPYDWQAALKFEGAWDYGFAKWLFQMYGLTDLQPWDIVLKNTEEIRAAATTSLSKVAIYVPVNTVLRLDADLGEYEFTIIDLEHRRFAATVITVQERTTVMDMHDFESDVLVIGVKK